MRSRRSIAFASLILMLALPAFAQDSTKLVTAIQDICWSPDAKAIYFSAMRVKPDYSDFKPWKWHIYKYNLGDTTPVLLIDSALGVAASPSGKQIVTAKLNSGNRDLFLYDTNGQNPRRLTFDPTDDYIASFSPDGREIVFNSKRSGSVEIYITSTDSSAVRQVTTGTGFKNYNPSWSPDGKHFVYYVEKGDRRDQIHVMNIDGSHDQNITNDSLNNFFPNWIDTNTISYASDRTPISIASDGSHRSPILNLVTFYVRYSPDKSMIAYVDIEDHCIQIISASGDPLNRVAVE